MNPTTKISTSGTCNTGEVPKPARNRRRGSIRSQLVSLVLVCVLPVWIAVGFLVYHDYWSRRALTEQRMLETARALTTVVDRDLSNMQATLKVLATSNLLAARDLSGFYRHAQTIRQLYPGSNIVLSIENGQELVNLNLPFGATLHERGALHTARQVFATGRPVITSVYRGPVTGQLNFSVDVPVFRDGRVVYDLAMILPVNHVAAILSQQHLPPDWIGTIIGNDNAIVARTRLPEQFVGKTATPGLLQHTAKATEGIAALSNIEGTFVFASFSRSAITGWTVVIGVPKAFVMAKIWRSLWWTIAGTALLSLAGIALAWPIARNVDRIERQSRRWSDLVESSDDAIVGTSLDGIIESWNHGAERLFGYPEAEIVGLPITTLVPDDQLQALTEHMRRVRNREGVEPYRTTCRHKNGSLIPVSLKVSPILDQLGTIVGASAVLRDVSSLKKAEEALRENEERLRLFIEHAPAMLAMFDREMRYLQVSRRWLSAYGPNDRDVRGMSHYEIFPEIPERWKEAHRRGLAGDLLREESDRFDRADGSVQWLRWEIRPWRDAKGEIGGIIIFTEEISERKQAEEALRESEARYRSLFENNMDAVFLTVTDGTILAANPAACAMFGMTKEELCRVGRQGILDPGDVRHASALEERSRTGRLRAELLWLRKDGAKLISEVSSVILPGEKSKAFIIMRDMTNIRKTEEALAKTKEKLAHASRIATLGELTASIAHEINQPLAAAAINGDALRHWIAAEPPNLEEAREAAKMVVADVHRAGGVIARVRSLLRKAPPEIAPVDINKIIRLVLSVAQNELKIGQVAVQTELADVPVVLGDQVQLEQVVLNLILNAVETMRTVHDRQRRLIIRSMHDRDFVTVQVEDSGVGIDPQHAERIFEPFFTTKSEGIGLGLAISRSIIEAHGGRLWASNECSHGAVFHFSLPQSGEFHG